VNCIVPTPNRARYRTWRSAARVRHDLRDCGDKVFKRKGESKGANAFADPIKPKAPSL